MRERLEIGQAPALAHTRATVGSRCRQTFPELQLSCHGMSSSPTIVLTTLNAKYIHAAFGLRYLLANMGRLRTLTCIVEFDINQRTIDVIEILLARNPKIIGLGVYIWNAAQTVEVVASLKRLRPEI